MFQVTILGCGAATPTSRHKPTAQVVNVHDKYFLIDCGESTQIQLRKFKAKFQSIDHIFISHLHGDHFFGLPGLLSSMHLLGRKQTLTIYGPENIKSVIEAINKVSETRLNFSINWVFTKNQGLNLLFEDKKLEVFSFPLKHRIFCTGFLFKEKPLPRKIDKYLLKKLNISVADILLLKNGLNVTNQEGQTIQNKEVTIDPDIERAYAYCSDTIFNPKLTDYISNVDLLYHESTFLEEHADRAKKTYHSTAKQAAEMAKKTNAKQLLLGHFSARYSDLDLFLNEAEPIFKNCILAIDGKKIKI
jgi:ribonuclease Z